jgi:hypothetical protein
MSIYRWLCLNIFCRCPYCLRRARPAPWKHSPYYSEMVCVDPLCRMRHYR